MVSDGRDGDGRIDDSEFEQNKEPISQDIANTLQRVVNDYANHWKGVLGESIQNSYDAWATNRFDRGIIPEDQKLIIELTIDINRREYIWKDNAGGMPEKIFRNEFTGLDTPGDEKQSGGAGGAYGRGFHVISGLGQETYAETKHGGFHGGLVVRGAEQAPYNQIDSLTQQGTRVAVKDCKSNVILKLSDRERVHEHVKARFQRMLEHDDVTVLVTIDGVTEEVEPVDLSEFEVLWEGDIEFEHVGEQKVLKDAVVYKNEGQDIPFEGMAMCKRHNKMGQTYMRVKQYRPQRIKHIDEMFGFCDASVLCPKYENNAHTGWVGGVLPAGIKGKFEQIERDEFHAGPTNIAQRDEIVESALDTLTNQWEENPFGVSTDASDLEFAIEDDDPSNQEEPGDTQLDGPTQSQLPVENPNVDEESESGAEDIYVDEENDGNGESEGPVKKDGEPEPVLKCRTKQRTFDAGETIDIRVLVDNPEGTGETDYEVEGEVEGESGTTELKPRNISVAEGDTSGGADGWEFDPSSEEGKFVFRAKLHSAGQTGEEVDTTNTYFFVGETIEEETGKPKRTFIEDIELFPDPDDEKFRHELQEGDDAFLLLANPSHPEYRYAEKLDGRNSIDNQVALLVRWGQEAVMNYLLLDRLEAELQNHNDDDGEPLDEKFTGLVRRRLMENLSQFSAQTYDSLS
ncbi:ATP-binding protein [Halanaeroarchaeum sulfurireducens]|uniref:Uncharacterized protein n=1 Tax=Halanaeroarchaeum sulfurireducens TaxID=1604004 RepID=A0A0F7P5S5_9EURY|nr:ATP-binding protein [Halanaeroarchaeum sulfurireducens]AKH96536.1 hypothetical protein HLASF_0022 [Halanaeroarchaeum sulfurireducens]ALG80938.1 hypothetical protein HLASA_0022 [Halanaeroarchaeum sulfurireducens]